MRTGEKSGERNGVPAKKVTDIPASQYSPRDYVIPANDHQGHSVRKQFRCSPSMSNEIAKIIQSHKWPWSTEGDMMRWATWEAVKKCERMEEIQNSMYAVANNIIEVSRETLMIVTFKASLDAVEKSVQELMGLGMEEEALRHLSELKDQAAKVSEPMWRKKYADEFERRFGRYWKDAKAKGKSAGMVKFEKGK
jgi:hypothetical protein